jgi:hypothetical protein
MRSIARRVRSSYGDLELLTGVYGGGGPMGMGGGRKLGGRMYPP